MMFVMVSDNITLGQSQDYVGLVTTNTSVTTQDYLSNNHTFGIQMDIYQNPEFDDGEHMNFSSSPR